jgi:predicted nucleic-acid-binding protein
VIGVDTNVMVRYLTRDDEAQWQQATQVIQGGQQCFLTHVVLCELVWVLRGKPYAYSKDEILTTLAAILQSPVFEFEDRSPVYQALQRSQQGQADFSDYLIGAIAYQSGCRETVTFDQKLTNERGFRCLVPDRPN